MNTTAPAIRRARTSGHVLEVTFNAGQPDRLSAYTGNCWCGLVFVGYGAIASLGQAHDRHLTELCSR